ncbi:uncharacterized protein LOC123321140 [Coccinella septempunctata]|uniref:uncharacterized protein LOC123321140 n=1 Tax=Coccinella septempunctata TaxID=41139 RepID=UPI001D083AC4|nr:uncharacterized protein LOC123321140 [Coccinella septempunctata]
MAKMYRIFYLLLILLWFRRSDGKCVDERSSDLMECDAMDEDAIDIGMREYGCGLNHLKIRNSHIPRFQMPLACDYLPPSLTIRNSSVTSFICDDDCSEHKIIFAILRELDLSFNEIRELRSLETSRYLEKLVLRHNKINFLNGTLLANYNNLFHLDLSYNEIKKFTGIENQELTFLNLSHNLIEDVGNLFSNSKTVRELDLSYNKLRKISLNDFKNLKYVKYLSLSNNFIHTIEHRTDNAIFMLQNPFWTYHYRPGYQMLEGPFDMDSTVLLNIEGNNLDDLSFLVNQMEGREIRCSSLIFRKNIIKELHPFNFRGFISDVLDLSFNEIESMAPTTFAGLTLKKLYLDHNKITHLNDSIFSPLSGLELLNLSYNPLTTVGQTVFGVSYPNVIDFIIQMDSNPIPVSSLVSFAPKIKWERLYLTIDGIIEKRSFFNLISLEELHIVNSNITEIKKHAFKGLSRLKKISFENSTVLKIEPGAFLGLINVVDLDKQNLFYNISTLEAETFVGLSRLERLDLSRTGIRVIEDEAFLGLDSLKFLYLSHNKIKYLSRNTFVGLKNLNILDLSNNELSTLSSEIFRDLEKLSHLHLEHNALYTFDVGCFSNLRSLEFLNISHNNIRTTNWGYPVENLRVLDINFNYITSFYNYLIDLEYYRTLKKIGIGENSWSCDFLIDELLKFHKYSIDYTELSILNFEDKNIHGIHHCYRYRISYMLLILLWFRSSDGKCVDKTDQDQGYYYMECDSMDEDAIDIAMRECGCNLIYLLIRDSHIPRFQMPLACDYLPPLLTIRNSSVSSFICGDDCSEHKTIFDTLTELDLSFNEIRELSSLDTLLFLRKLVLRHNKINFLNGTLLANYNNLFHLDLSYNEIKKFTGIENQELTFLNLSHNLIEDVGNLFSNSKTVQELDLSYNKLRKISLNDFKNLKYVKYLSLSNNFIHTIEHRTDNAIIMLQNPFWTYQDRPGYQMLEGPFDMDSTVLLNIEGNNLDDLSFLVNQIKGREIRCSSLIFRKNIIKELHPFNFGGFISDGLDLSFNEIESMAPTTFEGMTLRTLYLDHNKITHLNDSIFSHLSGLVLLNLSYNPLTTVGQTVFGVSYPNVVDFSHCLLTKIPPGNFTELLLDFNVIRQIEPSNQPIFKDEITSLNIVSNPIPVSSLVSFPQKKKLERLYLTIDGIIEKRSFFNLISLEELHIVNSNITEIKKHAFKGLSRLKKISFENSTVLKIEPGAFLGLINVVDFDKQNLFDNISTLKAETFVGLSRLERLDLSRTGIRVIEDEAFLGLDSLRNLYLSHNKIKYLSRNTFVGLKNLIILDLSNNQLSTLPNGIFRDVDQLSHLHLEHNSITKFDAGCFTNLKSLIFLNVSHNQITNIEKYLFYPLKKLEVLDINANFISAFDYYLSDIEYYRTLKKIGISENSWSCEYLINVLINFDKYSIDYTALSVLNFEDRNIHGIRCI